jgi:3-deoxy-manno-octulosonate cytidylyltransferase (CMP-KDO synthetase)
MLPVVLIPARMQSSRLPNKPLADIAGKPMIWHVWQRALAANVSRVVVATDSQRIVDVMSALGAEVVMTSDKHLSGTERLAEASAILGLSNDTPVVNVQGDEPLIASAVIDQIATLLLDNPQASMATLWEPITDAVHLMNPNMVKVVTDQQGYALAFSRSPIPWHRDLFGSQLHADTPMPEGVPFCRHLGIYAYKAGFLRQYAQWPSCEMERVEALEQLRILWNGHKIILDRACAPTHAGVDTPEDLARVRAVLEKQ